VNTFSKEKRRQKERKKFQAQALAYLMSIVLPFFCTFLLIVGHH
jgi:hypothetical protein